MIDSPYFWREWPRELRRLFVVLGAVVALLLLAVLAFEVAGHRLFLDWYLTTETQTERVAVESISVGLFDFDVPADVYLLRQHFEGSTWLIRPWLGPFYLGLLFVFYSLLFTVATYLPRFWYLVAGGLLIALLASMRLEQLLLFGWFDYKPLALAILLFLPLSYYFHAFNKYVPLLKRLLAFLAAFVLLALLILLGAKAEHPFYTLAQYNYAAPVIITAAFALLVGHEVVYFILKMITRGKAAAGSQNWVHFFTFSLVYLGNVALVFARNARYIDWDFLYVNEFLLLAMAAVLGLWGMKAREVRYEGTAAFYPVAALFYVAAAGIAFLTIGFQQLQGNDAVLETFEDAVVFSQLGFGTIFLLYVIVNFITPLMRNMAVYRIVFRECTLPYPTYRLAGMVAVAGFFFLSNQAPLNQAIGGYYNNLGDLYKVRDEHLLSEQYYLQGSLYAYQNHKSNYQLGFIANSKANPGQALYRFELAAGKNPSPQAFVNLSNQYKNTSQFFKGIFALQQAGHVFPSDGYIGNNLGALYSSTNILDSAAFYLKKGLGSGFADRASRTNLSYVAYKAGQQVTPEEVAAQASGGQGGIGFLTNTLALWAKTGGPGLPDALYPLVPDTVLSGFTFPFTYNASLVDLGNGEGPLLQRLPVITESEANARFHAPMSIALALQKYFAGEAASALQILNNVQQAFPTYRPYCYHLMSVMSLDQGAALRAAELFEQAAADGYPGADINQAIAISESGNWQQATLKWVLLEGREGAGPLAGDMLRLIETTDFAQLASDQDRYQYCRWFGARLPDEHLGRLLEAFESEDMKKAALVSLAKAYLSAGRTEEASQTIANPELRGWIQPDFVLLQVEIDLVREGISALSDVEMLKQAPLTHRRVFEKSAAAWEAGDAQALAAAVLANPFNGYLVKAAADHLKAQGAEELAYDVLVASLDVNPHNATILQAYVWLALDMGFDNYAENAVIRLLDLLPAEDYRAFERAFDDRVEALRRQQADWNF